MKKYENAEIEVIEIRKIDIILSSTGDDESGENMGG